MAGNKKIGIYSLLGLALFEHKPLIFSLLRPRPAELGLYRIRKLPRPSMAPAAAAPSLDFGGIEKEIGKLVEQSPNLKQILARKLLDIARQLEYGDETEPASANFQQDLSPAERIKQGFAKFKAEHYLKKPDLYKKLSEGQAPKFMIIACSDSRVCPTTILGLQPGEAFMVRNIASMVPAWGEKGYPSTSAAVEYGVLHLKIPNILVIGHSRCGGIKALMSSGADKWSDYIQDWIKISDPARSQIQKTFEKEHLDHQCSHCEKESVNVSLFNLVTFPWVKAAVLNGSLALHGGHYSFVDGSFTYWTLDVKKSGEDKF